MNRVLSVVLAALALRVAIAVLTEYRPIFPAYYYVDARLSEARARDMEQGWRYHRPYTVPANRSERAHAAVLAAVYYAFGEHPLAGKLLNAALGAASAGLAYAANTATFGAAAALASAATIALWPSHAFNTSQNFKDALSIFFCWAALAAFLPALQEDGAAGARIAGRLALGLAALALLGFLRAYLLTVLAVSLAAASIFTALWNRKRRAASLVLTATLISIPTYRLGVAAFFDRTAGADRVAVPASAFQQNALLVETLDGAGRVVRPWSPEGLTQTRRIRQAGDQRWAETNDDRRVATQLFPEAQFGSWLDVVRFIPKASFYVLFMPLPGLYPSDGKIGRLLAAFENMLLLALALLAVAGILRRRRWSGPQVSLLAFFLMMTAGSALLEFDLGSATRHKLNYLPALFPFAFSYLLERRKPRTGRLKVMQALECGGPGGTGNQVAALCNALPQDRFETQLVYNVRPGCDAEAYRKSASGAAQAFLIPTFTREISPLRDLRAFWSLYRLFKKEQPDVVHAHSSKAGALARPAAWLAGVPRVFYTPHGYGFLQRDHGAVSRAVYKLAELSVSWIGTVVAVSPSEAAFAKPLAWGNEVVTVNDPYLGALPAPNHVAERKGALVGACGRLTAARHPAAFVNLSQRLTDSRNGLKCVWIGGGELEAGIKRDLENMNLLSKVEVTGWLPGDEAQKRLAGLDVLVHYSRWDGLPNAVLEAMAHGIPVVASDVPGCRDAVVDGETGFLAKSEKDLLEKTLRLIDDAALRRKLGEAGRRRVQEHFSQQTALAKLEALYEGHAA